MRTLFYLGLSILIALAATFMFGFVRGVLGEVFPGVRHLGGGAVAFSTLAVAQIYSRRHCANSNDGKP
jgi:Na+/citrate or Na+/malate symporter